MNPTEDANLLAASIQLVTDKFKHLTIDQLTMSTDSTGPGQNKPSPKSILTTDTDTSFRSDHQSPTPDSTKTQDRKAKTDQLMS
jgi:hypothetical protein